MELPVIPMCTLKANAQHPNWYQQMMSYALSTGVGYDAVWQCEGALFRVHKFVLAAFSTELYVSIICVFCFLNLYNTYPPSVTY